MKARANQVLETVREYIATHNASQRPILTAYVNVDTTDPANQRERPAWQIALKNEHRKIFDGLDPEELKRRQAQERWAETDQLVMEHLRGRKPAGKSVVMFTDHVDIEAIDLPVPVETRLYYGLPQVKQLLFAMDQYRKYMVVIVSAADIRLLEVFLTRTTDEVTVATDHELTRAFGRKAHTLAQGRRDAEYRRRYIREVADTIHEAFLGDPDFDRLVLAGNLKQAHAVLNTLHPAVAESVVAVEAMDVNLPDVEVSARVKEIADVHEAEHDLEVVERVVSRTAAGGRAVLEEQGVRRALERGAVKRLVVPFTVGEKDLDEVIIEATVDGAADVEFVYGEAAERLSEYGGIGATLYFPLT